jgi:hypothetical protein
LLLLFYFYGYGCTGFSRGEAALVEFWRASNTAPGAIGVAIAFFKDAHKIGVELMIAVLVIHYRNSISPSGQILECILTCSAGNGRLNYFNSFFSLRNPSAEL